MTVAATVFSGCPVKITRRAQETILKELFKTKQNFKKRRNKNIQHCFEGTRYGTSAAKPHSHCRARWREHHGFGLLCHLRAWTVRSH